MSAALPFGNAYPAYQLAEEQVCEELGIFSAWVDQAEDRREPCAYFGPISTTDLFVQVLLNDKSNDAQLAAAAREIRRRFLADEATYVQSIADKE